MQTYCLSLLHESRDRTHEYFAATDLDDAKKQAAKHVDFVGVFINDPIITARIREFTPQRLGSYESNYGPLEYTILDKLNPDDLPTDSPLDNSPALIAEGVA